MNDAKLEAGKEPFSSLSILGNATRADIRMEPYPHMLIHDALPTELFQTLEQSFPSTEYVAGDELGANNKACLKGAADVVGNPDVATVWRDFFDYHLSRRFFEEFLGLWGETIENIHPGIEQNFGKPLEAFEVGTRATGKALAGANRDPDLVLDCVFGVNTPVRTPTPVRGPHIDSPFKLFSSLLYFRDEHDDSQGGEHEMYRLNRRMYPKSRLKKIPWRYVSPAKRFPYQANTLLFWLNSALSIHGVTPRAVTNEPRRYVAVMGECYGGKDHNGFFGHHPEWDSLPGRLRSLVNI